MNRSKYLEAVGVIVGTVVGLGIFSIPYAGRLGGVWPGVVLILLLAAIMVAISFLFAEIIVFSGKNGQGLVFYANKYIGKWAGKMVFCSIFIGYTGSLVAYILAITVFVSSMFGLGKDFFWPIILFLTAINSLVLLKGVRSLGRLEFFLSIFMVISFLVILFSGVFFWEPIESNWSYFLLPYGVIWFALTGESAIPIAIKILERKRKKIKSVIIVSYSIIVLVTVAFFVNAIKVGDGSLKPDPFLTMSEKMGDWVNYLGSALSIVAVITSFWVAATYLKKILEEDIAISQIISWLTVIFLPLALIFIGVNNFIKVISLIGILMGTVDSLIIVSIYSKIFRNKRSKPKILPFRVPVIFLILLEILLISAAVSSLMMLE